MRGWKAGFAATVLVAVLLGGSSRGLGTSFSPLTADEGAPPPLRSGAAVLLFHSGTEETRRAVRAGDVLVALRSLIDGRQQAVGQIRVEAAAGALCFRGEVLEGEVHPHDIAHAGSVSLMVLATEGPCPREPAR